MPWSWFWLTVAYWHCFCSVLALSPSSSHPEPTTGQAQRIVIVGGGVGGLATAARLAALARQNHVPLEISVWEKNNELGGRCGSYEVDLPSHGKFRHERGPSLLLLPHIYEKLFTDCSSKASDLGLNIVPCQPAYQAVFTDGTKLSLGFRRTGISDNTMSEEEMQSRFIMDSFETDGSKKWDAYLQACEAYLDCGLPNFIEEKLDLPSFPAFIREALNGKAWPLQPHSNVLEAYFDSPQMRALASFPDLYVGLNPYANKRDTILDKNAPAVFGLLSALELHPTYQYSGVYAPRGGFAKVAEAMEGLCRKLNVKISCGQSVTSVSVDGIKVQATPGANSAEDEKAPGDTGSTFVPADLVICNADLPYAQKVLMERCEPDSTSLQSKEVGIPQFDWDDESNQHFSSGVLAFHWCLDTRLDSLKTHNVFLQATTNERARRSWEGLFLPKRNDGESSTQEFFACIMSDFTEKLNSDDFNFYVHRPVHTDVSAAPVGCDSLMVLLPCPHLLRSATMTSDGHEWFSSTIVDLARGALLRRLGLAVDTDLSNHILDESVETPSTMAHLWNVAGGTPFGLSHGLSQLSRFRPAKMVSKSSNKSVFAVGASARPGNGVPLVLVGAEQTVKRTWPIILEQHDSIE